MLCSVCLCVVHVFDSSLRKTYENQYVRFTFLVFIGPYVLGTRWGQVRPADAQERARVRAFCLRSTNPTEKHMKSLYVLLGVLRFAEPHGLGTRCVAASG